MYAIHNDILEERDDQAHRALKTLKMPNSVLETPLGYHNMKYKPVYLYATMSLTIIAYEVCEGLQAILLEYESSTRAENPELYGNFSASFRTSAFRT
jgi:hypothetical protein